MRLSSRDVVVNYSEEEFYEQKKLCNDKWKVIYPDGVERFMMLEYTPGVGSYMMVMLNGLNILFSVAQVDEENIVIQLKEFEINIIGAVPVKI